ncbi:MAG: OmpA family protein [Candidatus Omnitrophica bacterium]|nr:OmpA family protein [Candidatus Omnitrophota bacterium]
MKRWVSYAIVVMLLAGCSTAIKRPDVSNAPVVPGPDEIVAVDQAIILVDASSSMRIEKTRMTKNLLRSMFEMMPDGDYDTGMVSFGGDGIELISMESPYYRQQWVTRASKSPYLGGNTPLELSLEMAYTMLSGASGKTAVIIFSDGQPTIPDAAIESARKIANHPSGEVCIHTVHIGESDRGVDFMEQLASLSSCGSARSEDSLLEESALYHFVREVFIGPKPVVEEPPVVIPEPPKPKDSDNDGVTDDKDECPGTPQGAKVDERGCWVIPGVTFELDKAIIRPVFYPLLDDVVKVLKLNPDLNIYVDGHTCSRGTDQHNQGLSERRAKAVQSYLVTKGVDESRLKARGWGEKQPAFPNDTETNMSKNRRVELSVIE